MTLPLLAIVLAGAGGLLFIPIAALAFAFWLWMLVDCIRKENDAKIVWLLLILFVGIIGAPTYFFLRKAPRRKHPSYQRTNPLYQPWQKDQRLK